MCDSQNRSVFAELSSCSLFLIFYSCQVGGMVKDAGIVASTLAEVRFFAQEGYEDITYGVPIAAAKLRQIVSCKANVTVFVDSELQVSTSHLAQLHASNHSVNPSPSLFTGTCLIPSLRLCYSRSSFLSPCFSFFLLSFRPSAPSPTLSVRVHMFIYISWMSC